MLSDYVNDLPLEIQEQIWDCIDWREVDHVLQINEGTHPFQESLRRYPDKDKEWRVDISYPEWAKLRNEVATKARNTRSLDYKDVKQKLH